MRTPNAPRAPSRLPGLLVLLAVVAAAVTLTVAGVRGEPAASTPAEQVRQITSDLRCPVCKDLSAADSPAPLAGQMRHQVAEQLAAGRSPDEIRQGFIAAYGDSVLMSPPRTGLGQAAYVLPLLLLGVGSVVVAVQLWRWRRVPGSSEDALPDVALSTTDQRIVERALMRLREEEGR